MEEVMKDIIQLLKSEGELDEKAINRVLAHHNRLAGGSVRKFAKKHVAPYYLKTKANKPEIWKSWGVDAQMESKILAAFRMKPRRTASGVATITVITKPWKCRSNCLYCPNDVRMPKSYLSAEPACQRAERNYFDPYLQLASRLRALINMGHPTSKIELIILGGTFSDYPRSYQIWFVQQLFQALNDGEGIEEKASMRRRLYKEAGMSNDAAELASLAAEEQAKVNEGLIGYNEAVEHLYRQNPCWSKVEDWQQASMESLIEEHRKNEDARHRVVGLVVETRPDTVNAESLKLLRQLGCTKLQMGIQSLNPQILTANKLTGSANGMETAQQALDLARIFGFKLHTHFMVNLFKATPKSDMDEYRRFMTDRAYQPDEVKIYPCSLVAGTGLVHVYDQGKWQPYNEDQLLEVLASDVLATPEFTRISRMIRDISAGDILAGNKKGNLRQLVDDRIKLSGKPVREIRWREINGSEAATESLSLKESSYRTLHTCEHFLQWVTPENRIAGFLRLSLPDQDFVAAHPEFAVRPGQAMIREVHVYGRVADIGQDGIQAQNANAQHSGLGKQLVQRACQIAGKAGFEEINIISAVGTRNYYRKLGFKDTDLYQVRTLNR